LVVDHLAAEVDEELERVRKKDEVAEQHSRDEEQQDEWTEGERELALVRVQRGVDIREDLVEDDWHREGEAAEQRDPEVRGEVLRRTERDQFRDTRRE